MSYVSVDMEGEAGVRDCSAALDRCPRHRLAETWVTEGASAVAAVLAVGGNLVVADGQNAMCSGLVRYVAGDVSGAFRAFRTMNGMAQLAREG